MTFAKYHNMIGNGRALAFVWREGEQRRSSSLESLAHPKMHPHPLTSERGKSMPTEN